MTNGIQDEIANRIHPFMKQLFYRIAQDGDGMTMDGVWVYNENAQFVGGKVINLCSYVVTELMQGTEQEAAVQAMREIIKRSSDLPMKTWGILNAVIGIYRMEQKNIRRRIITPELWERLKQVLDWRTFVDCEHNLALIQQPTNYYGVAFGIARYRELLGWEEEGYSQKLLNRLMEHIDQYSGDCGFMDETPGQGRFDRYSILVPAEITSTILNTGMELPEQIVRMLRKSVTICLSMVNTSGYGFSYGRSTGAYGDTGVMEVLWAAARVKGLLSGEEEKTAYAYGTSLIRRFCDYWIDSEMRSVNLWEKGRRTDSYRNKNRILSENLSLCMQIASLNGWHDPGCSPDHLENVVRELETEGVCGKVMFFSRGEYVRALAVVRDCGHVWMLPLISGGNSHYQKSAYLPIPYEQFMVTGVPDESYRLLVPELTLEDGRRVMPVVYMKDIKWEQEPDGFQIQIVQDEQCVMNTGKIERFDKIRSETVYTWKTGEITRKDIFYLDKDVKISGIRMEFLTFSEEPEAIWEGVRFRTGKACGITAKGYEICRLETLNCTDESYHTPDGALKNRIIWERMASDDKEQQVELSWSIKYR